jgi:hypothetical protein
LQAMRRVGDRSRGAKRTGGAARCDGLSIRTVAKVEIAARCHRLEPALPDVEKHRMRNRTESVFALGCGIAAILGGLAPAVAQQSLTQQPLAQQSYLYPPEVRIRPVVLVPDPFLQRRYWDPRYCDFYRGAPDRRRCLPPGAIR